MFLYLENITGARATIYSFTKLPMWFSTTNMSTPMPWLCRYLAERLVQRVILVPLNSFGTHLEYWILSPWNTFSTSTQLPLHGSEGIGILFITYPYGQWSHYSSRWKGKPKTHVSQKLVLWQVSVLWPELDQNIESQENKLLFKLFVSLKKERSPVFQLTLFYLFK